MDTWKLRVRDIRAETPDTKTIFVERTDGQPLSYLAGQLFCLLDEGAGGGIGGSGA